MSGCPRQTHDRGPRTPRQARPYGPGRKPGRWGGGEEQRSSTSPTSSLSSGGSAAGRPKGRRRSPEDQDVRVDVRSVGPHDGAELLVHADRPKEGCVLPNGLEHRTVQVRPKVHLSGRAVGQREAHSEAPERLDATNPDHTVMLLQASKGQRGGRLTRRSCPAASPPPRTWSIRVACPSGSGSRVQTMIPECSGERRADDELPPIEGQDRAPEPSGFGKDVLVPNTLVGEPRLIRRQHVVTTGTERRHNLLGEILVREESGQGSSRFVLADLL